MAVYASSNKELRAAEVENEALEDEIEEAEENGASDRKVAHLKPRLAHWKA
jgi:hypothetical protein